MPSYLMPIYDPDVPNWRCINVSPVSNLYTVNQVTSIMFDETPLGSNSFGTYRCIGGCLKYPYLPFYSRICQMTFLPMRISPNQDTFTCCRYLPIPPEKECLLSCFEREGYYQNPNLTYECSKCPAGEIPFVESFDQNGNPLFWICKAPGDCETKHMMNGFVEARYCYDCPIVQGVGYFPQIVQNTPYGFQCKPCSYIHKTDINLG